MRIGFTILVLGMRKMAASFKENYENHAGIWDERF
jgi:hypothetical protein